MIAIVGAGPAGLSQAISLVLFASIPASSIQIFEQRPAYTRTTFVLLNGPTVERLQCMGVRQILLRNQAIGNCRDLYLLDDMSKHTYTHENVPTNPLFRPVDVDELICAQLNGVGFVSVSLQDLETALKERAVELGITFITKKVQQLVSNGLCYSIQTDEIIDFDLIIIAEGAKRNLISRDLGFSTKLLSQRDIFVRVHVSPVGPVVAVGKNGGKRLLYGDSAHSRDALVFLQYPKDKLDEINTGTEHFFSNASNGSLNAVQEYGSKATLDFLSQLPIHPSPKITSIAPETFVVQDKVLSQAMIQNVAVVGDAFRQGHFFTGLGTNLALVADCDLVISLVHGMLLGDPMSAEEFNDNMLSIAEMLVNTDLNTWFSE
ncbi:hypothetical protein HK103_007580 [Boothiomyces macroporosus]|uniref:FAD/NAD(P)-binding domain-containing protein n=1 Tax=Boothiomyces macroporosus TaxID=261099 RepID=A0AAD5UG93_9FUNG|nr:hypothetical protein HK103_007580 [Boothiomyces macroporosus]